MTATEKLAKIVAENFPLKQSCGVWSTPVTERIRATNTAREFAVWALETEADAITKDMSIDTVDDAIDHIRSLAREIGGGK